MSSSGISGGVVEPQLVAPPPRFVCRRTTGGAAHADPATSDTPRSGCPRPAPALRAASDGPRTGPASPTAVCPRSPAPGSASAEAAVELRKSLREKLDARERAMKGCWSRTFAEGRCVGSFCRQWAAKSMISGLKRPAGSAGEGSLRTALRMPQ
eukprot:scaffold189005_cov30-Tisochrysis_lutea.AAC.5